MTLTTTERNMSLEAARTVLEGQHHAKYDIVAPSDNIRYSNGNLEVIDDSGFYYLEPTDQFEDGISSRLDIPRKYLRRVREDAAEFGDYGILDGNVNHWLDRSDRNWFIRGFKLDGPGVARAFLSDRYHCIDHIDALFATLDGITAAGVRGVEVSAVDLSEKRLRVKITAPAIHEVVPYFLQDYRSPFTGESGRNQPVIYAGLVMSNSETGSGAFQIAPHITVLVCRNGMTRTADALRKVHLGERMEEGVIAWSAETRRAGINLIKSQATDAVTTFLSEPYLAGIAAELEAAAGNVLGKPVKVIEQVAAEMRYTDEERDEILGLFLGSGDRTAGGVMNAVTAYAQTVTSPDRAAELEEGAFEALAAAARTR